MGMSQSLAEAQSSWPESEHCDLKCYVERAAYDALDKRSDEVWESYVEANRQIRVLRTALEQALDVVEFCYMGDRDTKHVIEIKEALAKASGK